MLRISRLAKNLTNLCRSSKKLSSHPPNSESWMSKRPQEKEYDELFKGIQNKTYDPTNQPPPPISNKKRKFEESSSSKNAALQMSLQVLSNGYCNKVKTLMLITNNENYLINAGEGVMRQMKTETLKVRKIENIFMTRSNWACTGGLASVTLELGNQYRAPLTFHSPIDWKLRHNMRVVRPFVDQACQHVTQFDYAKKGCFEDRNMVVKLIDFKVKDGDEATHSYEIRLKKGAPRFMTENLEADDLKTGKWVQGLKEGREVTINGKTYLPDDWLDYSKSVEQKLLILDLSGPECISQLDDLIDKKDTDIQVIAHLSDSCILNDDRYLNWVKSFTSDCVHLFLDDEYPGLDMETGYMLQAQLNLISDNIFPLLHGQTKEQLKVKEQHELKSTEMQKTMKIIQSEANMLLTLRPEFDLDINNLVKPDNQRYMKQVFDQYEKDLRLQIDGGPSKDVQDSLDILKLRVDEVQESKRKAAGAIGGDVYPKVLFLGTASAQSTSYRNVTSILVEVNKEASMLMDCGEGSMNQLWKFFGRDGADRQLVKIKVAFLTHLHLDHHGGMYGFIMARIQAFKRLNIPYEKLKIMLPKFYIEQCLYCIDNLMRQSVFDHIEILPNELFLARVPPPRVIGKKITINQKYLIDEFTNLERERAVKEVKALLGLESIELVAVQHVGYSYAIILEIKRNGVGNRRLKPFKLVFSGDCRPNECLVRRGDDCDLLIHECTFDNERQADAIRKYHCTIQEALTVAKEMKAKQTVLTHFSARYGVLGHVDEIWMNNVGFSFDFMHLNPSNFGEINGSGVLLKTLFKNQVEKNKDKNRIYVFQKQREQLQMRN